MTMMELNTVLCY